MFQIAICDDDKMFCESFRNCLEKIQSRMNVECNISIWHKGCELLEYLANKNKVDLLFLDINLKESSGVSIGRFIREELADFKIQLVYISYEQRYVMQLFETEPMDFLIKPIEEEKVEKVLQRFLKRQVSAKKIFTFKEEHGNVRIPYDSIWYFQSMNHKVIVHCIEGQKEFYGKLTDVEDMAPDYFVRIHKSYLVNEHYVSRFHYDKIILQNNQKLTISKSYRSAVQNRIGRKEEDNQQTNQDDACPRKQVQVEQKIKVYENQLEMMQQSNYRVHALHHDMKHHIQNLYIMAQKNQTQNVLQYLEQMQETLKNPKEYVVTGNQDVDAILNYMLEKAERMGVKVEHKVKVTKKVEIEFFELTIVLCNLLENAMLASAQSQEKQLSLHIEEKKGMLIVCIKNTHSGNIVASGEQLISTKEGEEHGFGLANVKNIIEMYQGSMKVTYDDKTFLVKVVLYL